MALTRKNLTLDADRLHELAVRRGDSESAVVREAIEAVLFADEFVETLRLLHEAGFALEEPAKQTPDAPPVAPVTA
jgi:predicted DNA-binding protein